MPHAIPQTHLTFYRHRENYADQRKEPATNIAIGLLWILLPGIDVLHFEQMHSFWGLVHVYKQFHSVLPK